MKTSYLDLCHVGDRQPDLRDGLKPVHRRILLSVWKHAKLYRKSARAVGRCYG
jgi:DNA gyrase/topoisomerase IV subunit A